MRSLFGGSSPLSTVLFCLICLVAPTVLCFVLVGPQTILEYAGKSRPYSVLLDPASYQTLEEREDSTKIVCFGDSNYFYPPHKSPKAGQESTYLPTFLHEELSASEQLSDVVISQRAFASAGMFDYYCMVYEAMKFSPDLILIPINWRSFGINEWDLFGMDMMESFNWYHPELSALVPFRSELSPGQEDPIRANGITLTKRMEYKLSLYALYPIGMKAWALENAKSLFAAARENLNPSAFAAQETVDFPPDAPVIETSLPKPGAHVPTRELEIDFPMTVESSNMTYRSMAPLAHIASKRDTKILFFIWPLDQEYFEQVGHLDRSSLEESKKLIASAVDEENIYFLDLSNMLGHEDFFDQYGHCLVEGRHKVAKALAPKIENILSKDSSSSQ